MLLFECKMSPIGPCIRTLCPQLMVLFGKIIELLWGGTWLEERCHRVGGLRVCTVWSHFLFFISRLLRRCDGLASCSYSRAFPVMMGCIPKGKPKQTFFPVGFHQPALLQQWEINFKTSSLLTLFLWDHTWIWNACLLLATEHGSSNMDDAVLINICIFARHTYKNHIGINSQSNSWWWG